MDAALNSVFKQLDQQRLTANQSGVNCQLQDMAESTRNFSPLRTGTANKNERDKKGGGTAESLQNVTIKSSAHNLTA